MGVIIENNVGPVEWFWNDVPDNINEDDREALYDATVERIKDIAFEGYIEGELNTSIIGEDGEDIEISGWWRSKHIKGTVPFPEDINS